MKVNESCQMAGYIETLINEKKKTMTLNLEF